MKSPHVVIVGGGFGGLAALAELRRHGVNCTLIDRHPYTTFQPLLYQVATGGLNPGDITYALRRLTSRSLRGGAQFRQGSVTQIDTDAKEVVLDNGVHVGYDKLVLAPGVGANFFGIPGAQEHARTIYTRAEALAARDVVFSGIELMATKADPERRFNVIVVGGGATGVEMAGALAELKSEALPVIYPELSVDSVHVVLVEGLDCVLAPFSPSLQRYALGELRKRGVDVRLNTMVSKVNADSIEFKNGTTLDADVVIWASGVAAHDVVKNWGLPQGKGGRIETTETLQVKGFDDIYAVGDAGVDPEHPLPQLAAPANQTGTYAAKHILASLSGDDLAPFRYFDKGTMATIGRNAAVVQFPKLVRVTGFPAWLMWVVLHLAELLGGRNRIQTMISMAFRYFAWPSSAASIVGDIKNPKEDKE